MPERPDLEYVVARLREELRGAAVQALVVRKPVVLRVALPGDPAQLCVGRRFGAVARTGHFVRFALDGPGTPRGGTPREFPSGGALALVVSPMLAGVFDLVPAAQRLSADLAVAFTLDDGRQLRYRDSKQMGKLYLVAAGEELARVPGLREAQQGLDVLDPARFTLAAFLARARGRRDQLRVFLMDKAALDALGNAYADEVLWQARLHPKAWVRALSDEELARLHAAIGEVLGAAVRTIAARRPALSEKLRDFLAVRGRAGKPCPRCGTTLRRAGVRGHDACFCPACQPDQRRSGLVDWRKLPRG